MPSFAEPRMCGQFRRGGQGAPRRMVRRGRGACAALAAALPFASLVPETLVWKLAGQVMSAASGTSPRADHAFRADELPDPFEQLAIQLQVFPAPPLRYRSSQDGEPELTSDAPVTEGQNELREERRLIARLRREAPPPQWEFPTLPRKLGRNKRCYCGSGKRFKRCHGIARVIE